MSVDSLGHIDAVLLSHDQHFDNLDRLGRTMLNSAGKVLTTQAGAERLGNQAIGLAHWQSMELQTPNDDILQITGTPARHGPADADRGPVTGFVLTLAGSPQNAIYISGDTVWYEGVADVSHRFDIKVAILFMGAARVKEVGPAHLTFTAQEAVEAAREFANAIIIPLHYEGWAHYSESRQQIEDTFQAAGMAHRLRWLEPGSATEVMDW